MKKSLSSFAFVLGCLVALAMSDSAFAQTSATQKYTVRVPESLQITAPSDVLITHDTTDNSQVFPAQTWSVRGNTSNGVTVNFGVTSAFTHTTNNTFKRDASLSLAKGTTVGPAAWTVTKATDSTNYASGSEVATVTAASDGVGKANMLLTVTFLTGDFGTVAAGDYTTTVTGTVAANP